MTAANPSIRILRQEYARRRARNVRYSMRSFCRDLGMSQSLLSQVLNGKRSFTLKQAVKIANTVDFSPADRRLLLGRAVFGTERPKRAAATPKGKYASPEFVPAARSFDLHWTEMAVFAATFLKGFRPDVDWIRRKLGIARDEAIDALESLERKGLVRYDGDRLVRTHRKIYYDTSSSVRPMREYCRDMMAKASAELARTDAESCARRSINGFTLAVNPERIPEAKERLRNMLQELGDFLTQGEATELYQLNLQLFPLSEPAKKTAG